MFSRKFSITIKPILKRLGALEKQFQLFVFLLSYLILSVHSRYFCSSTTPKIWSECCHRRITSSITCFDLLINCFINCNFKTRDLASRHRLYISTGNDVTSYTSGEPRIAFLCAIRVSSTGNFSITSLPIRTY